MSPLRMLWLAALVALVQGGREAVDVEKTVQQVESILKANAQLPRLTRSEIHALLNDIRAEDAKSTSVSNENKSTLPDRNDLDNEVESATKPTNKKREGDVTTKKNREKMVTPAPAPTVMVVLPYTPRDAPTLQELYTRPPHIELHPQAKPAPRPIKVTESKENLLNTLKQNSLLADKQKQDFFMMPPDLEEFLEAHGLKVGDGKDPSFLLPLDSFKPLPSPKVIDGTVQLPENILLTYDLLSPSAEIKKDDGRNPDSQYDILFDPLRPQLPDELDTSESESMKSILPYDFPKKNVKLNYEPIDYDAIKVIPLNTGPSPVEAKNAALVSEQSKRQANVLTTEESKAASSETEPTTTLKEETTSEASSESASKVETTVGDSAGAADGGASIADLEASFGGAAPAEPGDAELPPPKKNGFYWMLDWNSFLEVGDGDTKVNIRFEPKLGDPQMFLPVNVP